QPAAPTDELHRAGEGNGGGQGATLQHVAADTHRERWVWEDAPRAAGGGGGAGGVRRWRVAGGTGGARRPCPGAADGGLRTGGAGGTQPSTESHSDSLPP